ncbi:DUF1579 domain-containing protein [Phenylobacterium sp.]|uniref:DUF1579 domain-containing protein n=1 Tax=Phenylobacterium sp. TaxID=1871053 RepID=UPI0025FB2132|nr:DUF1579 domain-containing protein [Phenylobacterium sp.]
MAYDAYDDGRRDFLFLYGRWAVTHRRLTARGVGADDWDQFEGTAFCQSLMGGLCNVDENDMPERGFQGLTFRTFDVAQRQWGVYWVNSQAGTLQEPVFGHFENGIGRFHGEDVDDGRPVKVVYVWEAIAAASARWSQAFSYDGGETWETNWTMDFARTA